MAAVEEDGVATSPEGMREAGEGCAKSGLASGGEVREKAAHKLRTKDLT